MAKNPEGAEDFTGAPDEFIDMLTCDVMKDPVVLPSKNVCDLSTAKRAVMEYCSR